MTSRERELELLGLLQSHEILRLRGFSFVMGPEGGVVIDRWGHVRGIWRFKDGHFGWTPPSYNSPVHWVATAEAAVRYTLVTLAVN